MAWGELYGRNSIVMYVGKGLHHRIKSTDFAPAVVPGAMGCCIVVLLVVEF